LIMDFTKKITLVTGASRGIGRSIAQQFAEAGAQVAVHYNGNSAAAEETRASLHGGPHYIFQADQSDPVQVEQLVKDVVAKMGRIDILVNNAGIYEEHPLGEGSYEDWQGSWRRVIDTNLIGPANLCYCVGRQMIGQGSGRIVNVSSRGAFRGEPEGPAYGASKGGLNSMSQSLARALAPYNIFVCVVAPGWVETDMAADTLSGAEGEAIRAQSPLNRIARPDEVARAVLFLASEGTDFLTGCIVDVNGASYLRS
jgi:NAD(P)-dependent dehydrogenase (short-subunit alcohol dehydrogenase family)